MAALTLSKPEHLQPNPLLREISCPVAIRKKELAKSSAQIRQEIIESKNKTEVIRVLLSNCPGINSDTTPDDEWWKKRDKLGV
jgi:hypothetical protein